MKKICAIATLALLASAAAFAAEGASKKRFSPVNDDFKASGYRQAQFQGTSPSCCPADLNCDGFVNGADIGLMLGFWGQSGAGDISGDGIVNGSDIGLLLSAWGPCSG